MSPREQSTSSSSVKVTDWPATARGRSPSLVTIRAIRLSRPEGRMRTRSPGRAVAGSDLAGEAAEVEVGPVDPLHRQAQRPRLQPGLVDLDGFQVLHQRRTAVPGRRRAGGGDVVALQPGDRDGEDVGQADLGGERAIVVDDLVEHRPVVAHQVHLVHRQHDVADADQADQERVAAGLGQHALARIDQDHREVGGRRAGDHVAGVLLVAGRVGDDELALVGGEEAVGDVDGDALLALGGEAVDQQSEVDLAALGADLLGVRLQRGQLVLEDHLGIVEQPPDQGRLAVVDAAAGDEAQQRLVLVRFKVGVDVGGDQIADVGHQS